ncbi:MAG: phosphatase PAP2 family protein [Ilumatobacter sp.]
MLLALATGGLWRVLWFALAAAAVLGGLSAIMRVAGMSWAYIRQSLLVAYVIGYVSWFFLYGIIIDRISVLLSFALFLAVASVGRPPHEWVRTGRDLLVFIAMWIAYDESRGIADSLGMPIQVESVRDIDRFLFFGNDGVVWLQERFLAPLGTVRWYDVVGSCIYYSHFIVPPITFAVLWLVNRHEWVRYMRRFATVMFIACAMFIALPTAPPWMAANGSARTGIEGGALPELRRPTGNGWRTIGLEGFVEAWDVGRDWANEVAAMPSLHSAYALFVVAFFWPKISRRWVRICLSAYPVTMAVTLMYFGEHYFVDALAGWAIVGLSFFVWNRIERRLGERDGSDAADADDAASDDAAVADSDAQPLAATNRDDEPATVLTARERDGS